MDAGSKARSRSAETPLAVDVAVADELLFDDLDAWLALVVAPIGSEITEDITVRLDGRYSLELLKRGYQGLLFHNLSAGTHWVELSYGGQTQQIEVDLEGGQVTTLTFALNRFAFVVRLRVQEQEERADWPRWSCGLCRLGGRGNLLGCRSRLVGRWPVKRLHVAQEHDKQPHVLLFVAALQIHADPCIQHHTIAEADVDIWL